MPVTFRVQADLHDTDRMTAQTVAVMIPHINKSAADPLLRNVAAEAAQRYKSGPVYKGQPGDQRAIAESAWWYAKHHMKFVSHDRMIKEIFGEEDQLQLLISPDRLLRMWRMEGDCAIYTMLVAAMLKSQGVPYEIVTVAVDPSQPGVFSHVYPQAILPSGRMPLDASHGDYPGWEVPAAHQSKRQVWSDIGNPISDQSSRWTGLHSYLPPRRQGLGDIVCDPYLGCHEETGPWVTPAPASSAAGSWTTFLQGALNQGINLAGKVFAPTTTMQRGPNGQYILTTPAGSNQTFGNLLPVGGDNSLLLWGGLAVGAVVLISLLKKK